MDPELDATPAMQSPEGTVIFVLTPESDLGDEGSPSGILFERVSGSHHFRLERDSQMYLTLYHSSPGTGTRRAAVDARQLKGISPLRIAFSWSPDLLRLYAGAADGTFGPISGEGSPCDIEFRVGSDGNIYGHSTAVSGLRVNIAGRQLVKPTAREAWEHTKEAISIHSTGTSAEGYMYEVVSSNLAICMLITGFEAYCRTRFDELLSEGITQMASAKFSDYSRVNFQDYDECKRAYRDAYGVKFSSLELSSRQVYELKQMIRFRHRVIHASPLITMVNELDMSSGQDPVFSNLRYQMQSLDLIDMFITNLHQETLALRSP